MERQEQLAARHIALRERAGLTQEQVAKIAGVSPTTISGIESGKITRPHLKTLLKLAQALGADVGELRESGKVAAPLSPEQLPLNGFEQEQRAEWEAAVRSARLLREHGRAHLEQLLSSWRSRRDRRALREMRHLLDEALDARITLQNIASNNTGKLDLSAIPIPEWEEIGEADRLYWSLIEMVLEAGLSVRREREAHDIEDEAA